MLISRVTAGYLAIPLYLRPNVALFVISLPEERMQLTFGMYGDGDFFSMKGVVEEFFEKVGLHGKEVYDPDAGSS